MKKPINFILITGVFLSGCVGSQNRLAVIPNKQSQVSEKVITEETITPSNNSRYLLYLPSSFSEKKHWPLIIFLHGGGGRGNDLERVKPHVRDLLQGVRDRNYPFIIVAPQCPEGKYWSSQVDVLIDLLDELIEKHPVDPNRIYLTGMSMGGHGTWHLACEYPDRFAAIAPICCWPSAIPEEACNLKNMPVWAFHGKKDEVTSFKQSEEMIDAIKTCGGKNAKLTIYPDASHNAWTQTYNNKELYDWFIKHRKTKTTNTKLEK